MALRQPKPRSPEVRRQQMVARLQRPWWRRHAELLRYGLAFVAYVCLGLLAEQVFSSWVFGVAFLVGAVWGLPALWGRLR
jgi:fatty acid desaturase